MHAIEIRLLYDNVPGTSGTRALWGFAAMVEFGPRNNRQRLLFDTGSNGRVLLKNMATLGVSPTGIDWLFLSHQHWDHIGGLDSILELNPNIQCILHQGFSKHLIGDLFNLGAQCLIVADEPVEFAPGMHSTGTLASDPPEHALALELAGGGMVISGCAHPGMSRLIAAANLVLPEPAHWAIGGFHLMYCDEMVIEQEIQALRELGITHVMATHCTGEAGIAAFTRAYGAQAHAGGAGAQLRL
jgi:7,8-dihydropterin-6-yl-methyl-4-(beta-D-ribofuranosyl)aminobenzene 5'-phosphate synthase